MNKTILIQLSKPTILAHVKSETYQAGRIDKSVDPKAIELAYNEQAGNEAFHEVLLNRGIQTNLADLLTHFSDYLNSSGQSSGDNIIDLDEEGDIFKISLSVSDRFNGGYADSLAKLSGKYVEEATIMDWWKPINEKRASIYAQYVERDLLAIKRCFNKTAPVAPTVPYTTELSVTGSAICIGVGEEHTVTYQLSDGAIDDIECRAYDKTLVDIGRSEQGFTVIGKLKGHTYAELYSRHNEDLTRTIHIYVTDQS